MDLHQIIPVGRNIKAEYYGFDGRLNSWTLLGCGGSTILDPLNFLKNGKYDFFLFLSFHCTWGVLLISEKKFGGLRDRFWYFVGQNFWSHPKKSSRIIGYWLAFFSCRVIVLRQEIASVYSEVSSSLGFWAMTGQSSKKFANSSKFDGVCCRLYLTKDSA